MGKIKGLFGLLVVVAGFYVAWNMIPPYFHNYQLQDDLDDIARHSSYSAATEDDIKNIVIQTAKSDDDVMLKEDNVTVTRAGGNVGITVKYNIHVEMMVHPVDLQFTANSFNKRI